MSTQEIRPGATVRPLWLRTRFWVGLTGLLVAGGLLIALITPAPGRQLDPRSPAKGGSKALARVLEGYGTDVTRTAELDVAARADRTSAVVVVEPDDYSTAQLRALLDRPARVVLVAPSARALAVVPDLEVEGSTSGAPLPGCSAPGPLAAGRIDLADDATTYRSTDAGAERCYDGALLLRGRLAVLGTSELLRNDALERQGVAALDVNVLTADRSVQRVVWLMPGTDADGPGAPTVWDVFPGGAHRAFVWLIVVGALVVLWRARRLGPPVAEPLPVIVRAAEVVEGHGRLYRRASARHRAAAALRTGTARRLAHRVGLPRSATPAEIAAVAAPVTGQDATRLRALLDGPPPGDDAALVELAAALQELETAADGAPQKRGEA